MANEIVRPRKKNTTERKVNENVVTLEAPEGMQYTDINHQIVGKVIHCIKDVQESFTLVTDEEAAQIAEEIAARFKKVEANEEGDASEDNNE